MHWVFILFALWVSREGPLPLRKKRPSYNYNALLTKGGKEVISFTLRQSEKGCEELAGCGITITNKSSFV